MQSESDTHTDSEIDIEECFIVSATTNNLCVKLALFLIFFELFVPFHCFITEKTYSFLTEIDGGEYISV